MIKRLLSLPGLCALAVLLVSGPLSAQYVDDSGRSWAKDMAVKDLEACLFLPSGLELWSCSCPGSDLGSIWGSGPYTADSNICAAAQHAGAIDATGGNVWVVKREPKSDYPGSVRNGISTTSWDSLATGMDVFNLEEVMESCGWKGLEWCHNN